MIKNKSENISVENLSVGLINKTVKSSVTYDVFLSEYIQEAGQYLPIINVLNEANEGDKINLYLANFGGDCHTCVYLANLLRTTPAEVTSIVTSPCYSAGATLALCTDSIVMCQNTFLMFHNYSSTTKGKGGELKLSVEETNRWIHKYFVDIHSPFLSKKEIKSIEDDKDVYIHFDDPTLLTRIKRHFKSGESMILGVKKAKFKK